MHSGPGRSPPIPARAGSGEQAPPDRPGGREGGGRGGGEMAAAPPHSWPIASAAILFSFEVALAGPSFPPPCQPPPPCSPSFPHSPAPRPSAPPVPLAAEAQPPFFLKGRVGGGYRVRPCVRRLCWPIGIQIGGPGPVAPPPEALLIGSGRRGRFPRGG